MALALTPLGTHAGGIPTGSGYLVESGDLRLLLDCGNGILQALTEGTLPPLDAVLLTHAHPDHVGDLPALSLYSKFRSPIPLWGPPDTLERIERLFSLFFSRPQEHLRSLPSRRVVPHEPLEMEGAKIHPFPTKHNIEGVGYVVEVGGRRIAYTGDTSFFPELSSYFPKVDLLLSESTFLESDPQGESRLHHLTAHEAGRLATLAQAQRLLLTHVRPGIPKERYLKEASLSTDVPVEMAEVGATILL